MSHTRALLPGEYADGARIVETTLRPVRPVCLIPDDAPDLAARFAESRCLAWGGCASYVIPYSRSSGLSEPWEEVLGLLDPDKLVALGPLRESEKDRLNNDGWFVYMRDEPAELFATTATSTLLHSALRAFGKDLKPPESERFVIVPRVSRGVRAYLPLLARFGGLNEADVKDALEARHSRYEFDLGLSELVRIEEVDPSRFSLDIFAGDLRGLLEEEEAERALSLPDLTLAGLQSMSGRRSRKASRTCIRSLEEEYHTPVLVTGAYDSVEDFALYWNLRAEHYFAKPFPLWIPLGVLEDTEAPAVIKGALGRIQAAAWASPADSRSLHVVSSSTSAEELEERLRHSYPEAHIGVESVAELFTTKSEYYYTTEKSPTHFERGGASIRPPRPENLRSLMPGVDCVAYELGIDEIWLPQNESIDRAYISALPHYRERSTKKGTLRFVRQFNTEPSETDLLDLRTPDGWTLLSSVFEEHGYNVLPTAKSKTALAQLALLGGIENLKVVASSKVRRLLKELSFRPDEEDREWVADRRTVTIDRFDKAWGRDAGRDILQWLIERRVLFRGATLKCARCQLPRWYEVDRKGEIWRCDGCKEDMPIPLHPQSTTWRYRINELYALGHNQGTLTPLLTLNAMHTAWGTRPSSGGLGFYPGIELKAKEGADVPMPHKEIDLVAMRGSTLILVECKESTEHLAEPEEASEFANQLSDLVELADHLGASQLLVTSSTTFPEDKGLLLQNLPAAYCVKLGWLDGHDLLDPNIFLHPLSLLETPGGGTSSKPEGWETGYLRWVRSSIANPTI